MLRYGDRILLGGADVASLAVDAAVKAVREHGAPLAKFFALRRPLHVRAALDAAERRQIGAHVQEAERYARAHPVPKTADRRVENDAAVRIIARGVRGARREVLIILGMTARGATKIAYRIGGDVFVGVDVNTLQDWIAQNYVRRVWTAHNHVALPTDDEDSVIDAPSETDERLHRLLMRVAPGVVRDTFVLSTPSCNGDGDVEFWSFREKRYCSCSFDASIDEETFARAARTR